MKRPVDTYRDMLIKEMSVVRPVTHQEIVDCLEANWAEASNEHKHLEWPATQRAARRIWAGLGLLAFGKSEHLKDTVMEILEHPQAATYKLCRYYVSAVKKLLPLPTELSPLDSPAELVKWVENTRGRLVWDESSGRFTLEEAYTGTPVGVAGQHRVPYGTPENQSHLFPLVLLGYDLWKSNADVDELLERCRRETLGVLLPDVALYELSKQSRAFDSWKEPLYYLSKNTDLVSYGRSVGEMMRQELKSGQPPNSIIDQQVTSHFRSVLSGLANHDESEAAVLFSRMASFIDQEIALREQRHADNSVVTILRDQWRNNLPESDVALLRSGDDTTFVRILAEWETASVVFQAAKNDGCTDDRAIALTLGSSVYGHMTYALLGLALDSLAYDEKDVPEPVSFRCLDYICLGTFCTRFATHDSRAERLCTKLMNVFQRQREMMEAVEATGRVKQIEKETVIRLFGKPRFEVHWSFAA
jgi:hypothetical protein